MSLKHNITDVDVHLFQIEQYEIDMAQEEGTLIRDLKAIKLDFGGVLGTRVKILRKTNNPPGKWLVRSMEDTSVNKS